jgi:hypothetical protein
MTPLLAPVAPTWHTERIRSGATVTISPLPTVPMVQAHIAIPLDIRDHRQLAITDVLTACWPDLPVCTQFEQFGGTIAVGRRRQWLILSLNGRAELMPELTETIAAILSPEYSPSAVVSAAAKSADQAALIGISPAVISQRRLWQEYYGGVPPVLDSAPRPADILDVTPADVIAAHRRNIRPHGAHIIVVGDVDPDRAFDLLNSALHGWSGAADDTDRAVSLTPMPTYRLAYHEFEGWTQTHIRLAAQAPPISEPDHYAAASVARLVLGGNFSSRMNSIIREKYGLSYRTNASFVEHFDRMVFVAEADVDPNRTGEALDHLDNMLDDLAENGPTPGELRDAIGYTVGAYHLSLGSQSSRASCLMSCVTTGIPLTSVHDLPRRVMDVDRQSVADAARLFLPERRSGVICGPSPARRATRG